MLYIEKEIDNEKIMSINKDGNEIPDSMKAKLIAKATLDKRLNAKDMRVYSYLLNFTNEGLTQEQIADIIDMSRSNINKSIEKLTAFNYINKITSKNWKETTSYEVIMYNRAGITMDTTSSIVRMLNAVDKGKDLDRLHYLSENEVSEYLNLLGELNTELEELEECIYKERNEKNMDMATIVELEARVSEIIEQREFINEELKDINMVSGYVMSNKLRIMSKTKLSESRVKEVLKNNNRKIALFIAYTHEPHVDKFREKYLEDYIKFLARFTDDLNEDFFILYYESLFKIDYTYEDIMKVAGVTHRDVPERKRRLQNDVLEDLDNMKNTIEKIKEINNKNQIKEEVFTNRITETLRRLIDKCSREDVAKRVFSHEEFILMVVALNKEIACQKVVCVNFNTYIKIKSVELYECIMRYYKYKEKY